MMGEKCAGPYQVEQQSSLQGVVLRDLMTGKLLDDDRPIPLDQILTGPHRFRLVFAKKPAEESIGQMLREEGAKLPAGRARRKQSSAKYCSMTWRRRRC
jgi:hypothetical protein